MRMDLPILVRKDHRLFAGILLFVAAANSVHDFEPLPHFQTATLAAVSH